MAPCGGLISLFCLLYLINYTKIVISLYVSNDQSGQRQPYVFNVENGFNTADVFHYMSRIKRDAFAAPAQLNITPAVSPLNDSHQQLMVYWVGVGSTVVICLARTNSVKGKAPIPSAVYISYNYGDSFINKTELFSLSDDKKAYASLDRFYSHPTLTSLHVFADAENQVIFVTTDNGYNLKRIKLSFHPSDVTFIENNPFIFLIHDKIDERKQLWYTRDMGNSWKSIQESVKTYYISTPPEAKSLMPIVMPLNDYKYTNDTSTLLFVLREGDNEGGTVVSTADYFQTLDIKVWMTQVDNFQIKGDFMFATTTKAKSEGPKKLYVSYKRGNFVQAVFHSELQFYNYYVADVSEGQIFVVASHSGSLTNLYSSLSIHKEKITFSLSLERIFCYFPDSTWNSWIAGVSNEAFADFHKVEGLRGIYIASYVVNTTTEPITGPEHLLTVITFDRGGEWQMLKPPMFDDEGLPVSCNASEGCSLHLSQKFNQLYPAGRAPPILSSSSAPGVIMATGTVGKSLKGRPGVYLSRDGGLTWRHILKDYYFFNFGDHGGVLVAVRYYRSLDETGELLYSTDEGENWKSLNFQLSDNLRVYGLMTEPGFNTTVFTMFGSLPDKHQWIILKVDLRNAFSYNCTKDDYKFWSPHSENGPRISCVLGRKEIMQRRVAHSNCFNGRDYDRPLHIEICDCDNEDFECDVGFEPNLANHQCFRDKQTTSSPYEVPSNCLPGNFYNRTKGYRKIPGDVCVGGRESLYLPDQIPCPINQKNQEFLLVAQRDRIVTVNLKNYSLNVLPILKLKNVIAIEFDMKNNCVYWADIVWDIIGRQCFNDGKSAPEILVDTDLHSIEGMALDWLSNNLYFVDGVLAKISLIRTDINKSARMRRVILDKTVLTKPRGIAVHPNQGYLFWTDWSSNNPRVSRAHLDGSNVKVLFEQPNVEWPNGLTIDHIAEKLYWVDARLDYIGSSDLDGKHFRRILANDETVSHPFAVAVFKDDMYWDDWKRNSIFAADKDHGLDLRTIIAQLPGLMDLKVFAHSVQEGSNACSNPSSKQSCAHICVGLPAGNFSCLCPQDMVLANNTCLCPGFASPGPNGTCPILDSTCGPGFFKCADKKCIPNNWVCDGDHDCEGGTDEVHCKMECEESMHRCPDGHCIPKTWVCDHDSDCGDGSDERNCTYEKCRESQHRCLNNRCIPPAWLCDGEDDCDDNSDEMDCGRNVTVTCRSGEFFCGKCIPNSWRCDGDKDCVGGEDERNCNNETCQAWQFKCKNNKCIMALWRCDGEDDCHDNSDEDEAFCKNQTLTTTIAPPVIPSDHDKTCVEWMFKCGSGRCIPFWWKCDGVKDCEDFSDEIGCQAVTTTKHPTPPTPKPSHACQSNQFQCASGECIQQSWVCDGMKDCDNGEDEAVCIDEVSCTRDQFKCRIDGSCVFLAQVCDGAIQCPDGSDEEGCRQNRLQPTPAGPSCELGYFSCDGSRCLPSAQFCDDHQDCYDGSDETNCTNQKSYQVLNIDIDKRRSDATNIAIFWWVPHDQEVKLQYLPSIAEERDKWRNYSWTSESHFTFTNLKPSTLYSMKVYVRLENSKQEFPPVAVFTTKTANTQPKPPIDIQVREMSATTIKISWTPSPDNKEGFVESYIISVSPPDPPLSLEVPATRTDLLIYYKFEPGTTYKFWVEAQAGKYKSVKSKMSQLLFDGSAVVEMINQLKIDGLTNTSVTFSWEPLVNVPLYMISVKPPPHYPLFPSLNTTYDPSKKITVDNLAPGTTYELSVHGLRNRAAGPDSFIVVKTLGEKLVPVTGVHVQLNKDNSVLLSWNAYSVPWSESSVSWLYGVYYAISLENLFKDAKTTTHALSVTTPALNACTSYVFAVGVVGPFGSGPLSDPVTQLTAFDPSASPVGLVVSRDGSDVNTMIVSWNASCPIITEPIGYEILVTETHLGKTSSITLTPTKESWSRQKITTHYGGQYQVTVRTTAANAQSHPKIVYTAPAIPPPKELHVVPEANGTYYVHWWEPVNLPREITKKGYCYEVLVSEGNDLNATATRKHRALNPPLILNDLSPGVIYSLAVKFVTEDGYESELSSVTSFEMINNVGIVISKSNAVTISVLCAIVFVCLVATVLFFAFKNRRLQRTFSNFVNSHYNRQSGSTTFGAGDALDDEDSPVIRGFSDDEPLVIA